MGIEEEKDIEPGGKSKQSKDFEHLGTHKAFRNLQRDLSQDDLNSPGTQKMLLAELERLEISNVKVESKCESLNKELKEYNEKYHKCDKEKAILENNLNHETKNEILYAFCLTVGSALFGISFSIREATFWWITTILGISIMVGGLIYKFKSVKK